MKTWIKALNKMISLMGDFTNKVSIIYGLNSFNHSKWIETNAIIRPSSKENVAVRNKLWPMRELYQYPK